MRREAERTHEQRDVDHAATEPEEARDETDAEAVEHAAAQRHRVDVALACAVNELAPLEMSSRNWERPAFPGNQPNGEQPRAPL